MVKEIPAIIEQTLVQSVMSQNVWDQLSFTEEPDCIFFHSDLPFAMFNGVLRARFESNQAGERIGHVLDHFQKRGSPMIWQIAPTHEPGDLRLRLKNRRMMHCADRTGMAVDLGDLDESRNINRKVDICEVTDVHGEFFNDWASVIIGVFEFKAGLGGPWKDMQKAMGMGPQKAWRHFVAVDRTTVMGTASMFMGSRAVLLANLAVLPAMRKKGVGTALAMYLCMEARKAGCDFAVLSSTMQGYGIYKGLGFLEHCNITTMTADYSRRASR